MRFHNTTVPHTSRGISLRAQSYRVEMKYWCSCCKLIATVPSSVLNSGQRRWQQGE